MTDLRASLIHYTFVSLPVILRLLQIEIDIEPNDKVGIPHLLLQKIFNRI